MSRGFAEPVTNDFMTADDLNKVRTGIEGWSGCWAEPWDYTTSHGWLRIKLQRRGNDFSCAILLLANCHRVSFDRSWDNFNPVITEYTDLYGKRYRVKDTDRLDVDCGVMSLSRTLKSYAEIPKLHDHLFGEAVI